MSVADKITRLTTARNNIRTALEDKGIDASEHGFEDFAGDVDSIETLNLQSRTISPSTVKQTITPQSGYNGLSQVVVNAISPTKAAQTYIPRTTNQTIASGRWLTGTQTIKGDANLVASNIANGVSIFGVTGTYTGSGGGIIPSGSLTITENDTYDVTNYAEVVVEVEGGGGEADPEFTINVSTQQALGMINDYFQKFGLYSMLDANAINVWQQNILPVIFNMS